ncbi:MAG TPA: dihydroxy-acid dehydratase [Alphaproteobacteria bacterium]|nr:dihydroxy-acid dehydratase [Alphaproteobacteria bacterium]HIB57201.1 dihydroxy-acid dehydratase [Alphaproteobacteria bacterium]
MCLAGYGDDNREDSMADNDKGKGLKRGLTHYGDTGFSLFLRKSFAKSMGYTEQDLERPVIGIANTASGFNNCHRSVPDLIEAVKRGVMYGGGLPVEFPTISLGEPYLNPTSMLFRNLMAIDTEEMIRAQPMDAVVLIGGCDKTLPAQLMAAASVNLPAISLVVGPMLTGSWRGERLGACTDCRRQWGRYRAGELDDQQIAEVGSELSTTAGTCMVMGTASTMALMTEALGMMLPGGATAPAVHAERLRIAECTGERAVQMADKRLSPDEIMTPHAFSNAFRVLLAVGGSTNSLIHMTAVAGRCGIKVDLGALDRMGRETPVLVDLKPSGTNYMEDLHKAGGLATILRELSPFLHLDCKTVTGRTLGEEIESARTWSQDIVRSIKSPLKPEGGIAVLTGNLAPETAIIKQSAATPELLVHEGRAVVFDSLEDLAERIDDPDLDVGEDDVLVLRNAGPKGAPGMPESGYIPIPKKLAATGVKDMVRLSDARMSGTAFGTIILHVCPEAAVGGPLSLVQEGDRIQLDVPNRRLNLVVDDRILEDRRSAWKPPTLPVGSERGYLRLHLDHVEQAHQGCDLDVLKPRSSGAITPE